MELNWMDNKAQDPTYISREEADRQHEEYEFACRVAGEVVNRPLGSAPPMCTCGGEMGCVGDAHENQEIWKCYACGCTQERCK